MIKYLVNIKYLVGEYLDHMQRVNMEKWGAPDNLIIYIPQRILSMLTFLKEIVCEGGAKNHETTSLKKYSDFFFFFTERRREGERQGEKHPSVVVSHPSPTGNLACNLGMCPNWELNCDPLVCRLALNPLSHTSQGSIPNVLIVIIRW